MQVFYLPPHLEHQRGHHHNALHGRTLGAHGHPSRPGRQIIVFIEDHNRIPGGEEESGGLFDVGEDGTAGSHVERGRERGRDSIDRDKQVQTQEAGRTGLEAGSTEFYTFTCGKSSSMKISRRSQKDSVNPVHLHLKLSNQSIKTSNKSTVGQHKACVE